MRAASPTAATTKPATGPAGRVVFGKISAGVFTTCGVAINGTAYCW